MSNVQPQNETMKKNHQLQDYTQWNLPEGAKARLGKGYINDIKFSPNGTLLAVVAIASTVTAKYQIDASERKSAGIPMALSAIVLACLVVVFAWWLEQRQELVEPATHLSER